MWRIILLGKDGAGSGFGKQRSKFVLGIATSDDKAAPEGAQIIIQHSQATQ
jgi:hypothetical protein